LFNAEVIFCPGTRCCGRVLFTFDASALPCCLDAEIGCCPARHSPMLRSRPSMVCPLLDADIRGCPADLLPSHATPHPVLVCSHVCPFLNADILPCPADLVLKAWPRKSPTLGNQAEGAVPLKLYITFAQPKIREGLARSWLKKDVCSLPYQCCLRLASGVWRKFGALILNTPGWNKTCPNQFSLSFEFFFLGFERKIY
jgi:hypothetical protein